MTTSSSETVSGGRGSCRSSGGIGGCRARDAAHLKLLHPQGSKCRASWRPARSVRCGGDVQRREEATRGSLPRDVRAHGRCAGAAGPRAAHHLPPAPDSIWRRTTSPRPPKPHAVRCCGLCSGVRSAKRGPSAQMGGSALSMDHPLARSLTHH